MGLGKNGVPTIRKQKNRETEFISIPCNDYIKCFETMLNNLSVKVAFKTKPASL